MRATTARAQRNKSSGNLDDYLGVMESRLAIFVFKFVPVIGRYSCYRQVFQSLVYRLTINKGSFRVYTFPL